MQFHGITLPQRDLDQAQGISLLRALALAHGLYYLVTGLWPVFNLRSFEWITGPKQDGWLVKTAGLLIAAIGAALLLAGGQRRMDAQTPVLASSTALSLAGIDIVYTARGRLLPIYLLDATAEIALSVLWAVAWFWKRLAR